MIELLKKVTIETAGFDIKDRGDCELLSNLIIEKTDKDVNYNTLRRLYGLAKYVKPNQKTLDILAQFNGYKDFSNFIHINPYEAHWNLKEQLYSVAESNFEEIFELLRTIPQKNKNSIDLLITISRELVYQYKLDIFEQVLFINKHIIIGFSYSEVLHFGNSIGMLFRNRKMNNDKLLNEPTFINYVFKIFVDYNNLHGYYGEWALHISKNTKCIETKIFCLCVLELKNYLNGDVVSLENIIEVNSKTFHPILKGRIDSIRLLTDSINFDKINFNSSHSKKDDDYLWDYFYEIIFIALLTKNFKLMSKIILFITKHKKINAYYQQQHYYLFLLMKAIYDYWLFKNFKTIKSKNETYRSSYFKYSYKDFLLFFEIIYFYHSQENKNESLDEYNKISVKLGYSILDRSYLDTYFD